MTLDLRIPNPCQERWEHMLPTDDGRRWCTRCERRITDFRGMSDGEIELVHGLSDVPMCGVYDAAQLRPSAPPPSPPRSGLVTLALGATLLSGTAAAQSATVDRHPTIQQPADASPRRREADVPAAEAPSATHVDSLVVRGTVRDQDGRPQQAVFVVVDGAGRALTDSLGGYEVRFGDRAGLPPTLLLRFARLGLSTRTVEVSTRAAEARMDVVLENSAIGLMVGGVPARRGNFLARLWRSIF